MTAHICFKIGKYLGEHKYKEGIISIMEAIPEIEIVNLTILVVDQLGIKKDGLTIASAKEEIEKACIMADGMNDELKGFCIVNYMKTEVL
jgi:hypothetical protein